VKPLHGSKRVVIILKTAKSIQFQIICFCIKIYLNVFSIESLLIIIFCCILLDSLYINMAPKKKPAKKAQTAGKKVNNTASKRKSTDPPDEQLEISKKGKKSKSSSNFEIEESDCDENEPLPPLSNFQTNVQQNQMNLQIQQQQQLNLQLQQQQQLNIQLQEQIKNLQQTPDLTKHPKKQQQQKKAKNQEELVDAVAIEYIVTSHKHPNYHLDGCIVRFPIEDIEGFGTDILITDVSKSLKLY
jgi:hypothetical protein